MREVKLGEIASIGAGNSAPQEADAFKDGTIPFVRTSDVGKIHIGRIASAQDKLPKSVISKYKIWPKGTILFPKSGASTFLNHRVITTAEVAASSHLATIVANPSVCLPDFLFQYLKTVDAQDLLQDQSYPSLNLSQLQEIPIVLPPLETQAAIVEKAESLLTQIESLTSAIELEEKLAIEAWAAILEHTFAELDPSSFKRLDDVTLKIQDGSHFSPKKQKDSAETGWYPYITSKNIRNNYMDLSNVRYVDQTFHDGIYPRCNAQVGDVLLTKDGANTGNVCLNTLEGEFSLLSSVCLIKTDSRVLDSSFLRFYLQSSQCQKRILGDMTGTAIKRIILKTMREIPVPCPPIEVQKRIATNLENALHLDEKLRSITSEKKQNIKFLEKELLLHTLSGGLL